MTSRRLWDVGAAHFSIVSGEGVSGTVIWLPMGASGSLWLRGSSANSSSGASVSPARAASANSLVPACDESLTVQSMQRTSPPVDAPSRQNGKHVELDPASLAGPNSIGQANWYSRVLHAAERQGSTATGALEHALHGMC